MSDLVFYTYYRSSCAYRVRIALALKGLEFEPVYVHLLRNGGENWQPDYREQNPQGLLPALIDGQRILTQSLAIIEYLDECYPEPRLCPVDSRDRAWVRALAQLVTCDIQPLNNLRVLDYLKQEMAATDEQVQAWYQHWLSEGLRSAEALIARHRPVGKCCHGDSPTLADICLIPQVYNAGRYHCDLTRFPRIQDIYDYCITLPAFRAAAPEKQADAA